MSKVIGPKTLPCTTPDSIGNLIIYYTNVITHGSPVKSFGFGNLLFEWKYCHARTLLPIHSSMLGFLNTLRQ